MDYYPSDKELQKIVSNLQSLQKKIFIALMEK